MVSEIERVKFHCGVIRNTLGVMSGYHVDTLNQYQYLTPSMPLNDLITRMHSSRMCTARSSGHPGVGYSPDPSGPGTPPQDQAPPHLRTEFLTHTLPQTLFAGSKYGRASYIISHLAITTYIIACTLSSNNYI